MIRLLYLYAIYQYHETTRRLSDPQVWSLCIGAKLALIVAVQTIETSIYVFCYVLKRLLFVCVVAEMAWVMLGLAAAAWQDTAPTGPGDGDGGTAPRWEAIRVVEGGEVGAAEIEREGELGWAFEMGGDRMPGAFGGDEGWD